MVSMSSPRTGRRVFTAALTSLVGLASVVLILMLAGATSGNAQPVPCGTLFVVLNGFPSPQQSTDYTIGVSLDLQGSGGYSTAFSPYYHPGGSTATNLTGTFNGSDSPVLGATVILPGGGSVHVGIGTTQVNGTPYCYTITLSFNEVGCPVLTITPDICGG